MIVDLDPGEGHPQGGRYHVCTLQHTGFLKWVFIYKKHNFKLDPSKT